jgi:hypothetical protein
VAEGAVELGDSRGLGRFVLRVSNRDVVLQLEWSPTRLVEPISMNITLAFTKPIERRSRRTGVFKFSRSSYQFLHVGFGMIQSASGGRNTRNLQRGRWAQSRSGSITGRSSSFSTHSDRKRGFQAVSHLRRGE